MWLIRLVSASSSESDSEGTARTSWYHCVAKWFIWVRPSFTSCQWMCDKNCFSNILNSTSAKRWECIPFCFIIHVQYTFIYFMKKNVKFRNTGALSDIFFVTSVLSWTCLLGKPPCEERDQVLWVYLHEALLLRSDKAHLILLFCQFW